MAQDVVDGVGFGHAVHENSTCVRPAEREILVGLQKAIFGLQGSRFTPGEEELFTKSALLQRLCLMCNRSQTGWRTRGSVAIAVPGVGHFV